METSVIKMTPALEGQDILTDDLSAYICDFSQISGTRCYLDDAAKALLQDNIASLPVEGLHFIDSGNYHYLSLLNIAKIHEDFALIQIDNHPDYKPASFGNITSCGGWVLEAVENLSTLQKVYMYGIKPALIEEVMPLDSKVKIISSASEISADLPLYISIDKDVLSTEYCVSDWDQGDMSLDNLLLFLSEAFSGRKIIGVDICGDTCEPTDRSNKINEKTNRTLIDFFKSHL